MRLSEALKAVQELDPQYYAMFAARLSKRSRNELDELDKTFAQVYDTLAAMGYPMPAILNIAEDYVDYKPVNAELERAKRLMRRVSVKPENAVVLVVRRYQKLDENGCYKLIASTEDGKMVTRRFDDSVSEKWMRDRQEFLASVARDERELVRLLRGEEIELTGRRFYGVLKQIQLGEKVKTVIETFRRIGEV